MKSNKQKNILDIAVLTAGRADLFDKCVDAILAEMTDDYKIQVCNNGHPGSQYEETYRKLPQGSVIKRQNIDGGFSVGANIVMNSGRAPLILFVTDDVFLHKGTINKLIKTMDDPTIGMCGLKLLFPEDSQDPSRPAGKVQHIGMASNIRGEMIHPLIGWSADNPKCNISREVLAVTGASFIIRRSFFNKIRGFNPIYGKGYYEDMELCFAVRANGGRVYINAEATATHGTGQTFKDSPGGSPFQNNALIFKSRWLSQMPWSEFETW